MTERPVTDVIDKAEFIRTTETDEGTAILTYFGENKIGLHCSNDGIVNTMNSSYVGIGYDNSLSEVKEIMDKRIQTIEDY